MKLFIFNAIIVSIICFVKIQATLIAHNFTYFTLFRDKKLLRYRNACYDNENDIRLDSGTFGVVINKDQFIRCDENTKPVSVNLKYYMTHKTCYIYDPVKGDYYQSSYGPASMWENLQSRLQRRMQWLDSAIWRIRSLFEENTERKYRNKSVENWFYHLAKFLSNCSEVMVHYLKYNGWDFKTTDNYTNKLSYPKILRKLELWERDQKYWSNTDSKESNESEESSPTLAAFKEQPSLDRIQNIPDMVGRKIKRRIKYIKKRSGKK